MLETENTCCFTGHRDIPRDRYAEFSEKILFELTKLYENGVRHFIAGGAIGFDMIAAVTVLNFKSTHSDITLELAIPCPDHDIKWDASDRTLFNTVRSRADKVTLVSPHYDRGCMFRRNRYMVDRSSYVIAYCVKPSGGSKYTIDYSVKNGKTVISI